MAECVTTMPTREGLLARVGARVYCETTRRCTSMCTTHEVTLEGLLTRVGARVCNKMTRSRTGICTPHEVALEGSLLLTRVYLPSFSRHCGTRSHCTVRVGDQLLEHDQVGIQGAALQHLDRRFVWSRAFQWSLVGPVVVGQPGRHTGTVRGCSSGGAKAVHVYVVV